MATATARRTATKERSSALSKTRTEQPQRPATAAIELPFFSASLTLPHPGANIRVGPVNMTLPTGYLYYGGLGALAIAGTLEWPLAFTLGAGGLLIDRLRKRDTSGDDRTSSPEHAPKGQ